MRGTGSAGANILLVEEAPNSNPHAKYKRGAVTRSPLVRLESELLQVFQNSIKQLQCCNNEFEDKNGDIHQAHTRLLWFRSTASCCARGILRRNVVLVDITQCAHAGLRR
ncbi:hypothetical protein HMPREF9347_04908 [Escherichia coli MS 124-1]|nr:hypothetical protein HMPREF9347_04908 [Escherichia coli MS 124-1]